jgi:hypothetical protein
MAEIAMIRQRLEPPADDPAVTIDLAAFYSVFLKQRMCVMPCSILQCMCVMPCSILQCLCVMARCSVP